MFKIFCKRILSKYNFIKLVKQINKSKIENIYIVSAAGYQNLGDDLMLKVIQFFLPTKKIFFLVAGINDNPTIINNVKGLGITHEHHLEKINVENSLVLIGGGTLFNKKVFCDEIYLKYAKKLLDQNIPYGFIGIEVVDIKNKKIARNVFKNSKFNAVRNTQSLKIIQKLYQNFKLTNTFEIGDLVEYYNFPKTIKNKRKYIGLCISPKTEIRTEELIPVIKFIISKNYKVLLFSFANHPLESKENDFLYAKKIKSTFSNSKNITVVSCKNFNEIVNKINLCKYFITSRLHATIVANHLKVKVLNISDESKCLYYCQNNKINSIKYTSLLENLKSILR